MDQGGRWVLGGSWPISPFDARKMDDEGELHGVAQLGEGCGRDGKHFANKVLVYKIQD